MRAFSSAVHIAAAVSLVFFAACKGGGDGGDGGHCSSESEACNYYHECPNNQDCVSGCCQPSVRCLQDSVCKPGGACLANPGSGCLTLAECNPVTECGKLVPCVEGVCREDLSLDLPCNNTCTTDTECPTGTHCRVDGSEGKCVMDGLCTAKAECATLPHADCVGEWKCLDGRCDYCERRCVKLCLHDTDCPAEASCISGLCEKYPADVLAALTAPAVDHDFTEKKPLRVGIADVPLSFPVGVSMAGYGARVGPKTPYSDTLGGSDSMWDRPRVKAFVFDNGQKRIAIVKLPIGWSDDFLASHIAWRIHQATQANYLDRLILSAPHSHSHPGRFWNVLREKKIGVFGHGDFNFEMFGRHTQAAADAVLAAIADLRPAKVSWGLNPAMDPEHKIHRDRRGGDFNPMDDSLVLIRIDDLDGHPRGLLVNFALHGTHLDGTTVSQDAPGGVEVIAQQNLQELTGYPVKVAFISGASGDVSPAGDDSPLGSDDWGKIQEVGAQAWPKIRALFESLEGKGVSDVALDMGVRRVPVGREELGYGPGVFRDEQGNDYEYGAFSCVGMEDDDPNTKYQDGALGCIFSADALSGGRPVRQFVMARFSIARIGNLGIVSIPGEPLGKYARGLCQEFMNAGIEYATTFGYSQDHHFYLMDADSWLQGGYEPSMQIWGWAEADYYASKMKEMFAPFLAQGGTVDNANLKPSWFAWINDTVTPTVTPAADAGKIVQDTAAAMERFGMVRLRWIGGHPGVDLPRMTLEKKAGDAFEPVKNRAGEIYSDDGHTTMTWYRGNYQDDHTWEISWEEGVSFAPGTYRIRIEGRYQDPQGVKPYTTFSGPIEVTASSRLWVNAPTLDNTNVSATVFYPPAPTNDDGHSAFSELRATGFLRHNGLVPAHLPWPVPVDGSVKARVTIQPPSGDAVVLTDLPIDSSVNADVSYVSSRSSTGEESRRTVALPASAFSAAHGAYRGAGTYQVTVEVQDAFGNHGTASKSITLE
ncbi:MAG: hypothetical protein GYA21_11585 [Myxococcales bacterium]|nr:hypothetical protein [Myxococcales bacterium]